MSPRSKKTSVGVTRPFSLCGSINFRRKGGNYVLWELKNFVLTFEDKSKNFNRHLQTFLSKYLHVGHVSVSRGATTTVEL